MDNKSLEELLRTGRERQFWLKPIGLPGIPMRRTELWPESELEINFVHDVPNIAEGAVLLAYRTGVAKLIYVAERLPKELWTTPKEIHLPEVQQRYPYFFKAKNLTPEYGRRWPELSLKPFSLAKLWNPQHQDQPASLGRIQHHSDRAPIPYWFAESLILRIMKLA